MAAGFCRFVRLEAVFSWQADMLLYCNNMMPMCCGVVSSAASWRGAHRAILMTWRHTVPWGTQVGVSIWARALGFEWWLSRWQFGSAQERGFWIHSYCPPLPACLPTLDASTSPRPLSTTWMVTTRWSQAVGASATPTSRSTVSRPFSSCAAPRSGSGGQGLGCFTYLLSM